MQTYNIDQKLASQYLHIALKLFVHISAIQNASDNFSTTILLLSDKHYANTMGSVSIAQKISLACHSTHNISSWAYSRSHFLYEDGSTSMALYVAFSVVQLVI